MATHYKGNRFQPVWIIAHRGYRAKYPENTLVAFQAAVDAGAPMIELDVMLSRDRKLVVIHDATLERTTNGSGPVIDYTLEELKQLDAGSWYDSQFSDERLPELEEVFDLVSGKTIVNIEIKSDAYEPHHPKDAIERQILELVERKKAWSWILISSFDVNILQQISSMENSPAIAFISKTPANSQTVKLCTRLKVFSWHPNHKIVSRKQVNMMHAAGIKVFPYNVDRFEDYVKMINMKVDGIITSDPYSAIGWSTARRAA